MVINREPGKLIALLLLLLVSTLVLVVSCSESSSDSLTRTSTATSTSPKTPNTTPTATVTSPSSAEAGRYTIIAEFIGCVNKKDFDALMTYEAQNDKKAFMSAGLAGLANGTMTQFKVGEVVYLMDATWTGAVQLRREGQTAAYWTNTEAIHK